MIELNGLSEVAQELAGTVADFMEGEVLPKSKEVDASGEFPVELYQKAFELGYHMLSIPEQYGGMFNPEEGIDHQCFGAVLEVMGYYEPGFAITMLCTALALKCVLIGGNDEQKAKCAETIQDGGYGAFCLTEPGAGSDAASLLTKYAEVEDGYILNGSKCFVTNGQFADFFIVFATKDKNLGAKGVSAFLVFKDDAGLQVGNHEDKMGLRFSNTTDLALVDCKIPKDRLLGVEGKGFAISMAGLDEGRIHNACISTGIIQHALDVAVQYANERVQGGKPIIKHQMIQGIIGDMAIRAEASKQLVRSALKRLDEAEQANDKAAIRGFGRYASICKTYCGDNAVLSGADAIQVLGGYGFSKEYPAEKIYRDAKIFQIFEGTNQIQRQVIARSYTNK